MLKKKLLSILSVFALTLCGSLAFAQDHQVSGTVRDASGAPVIGASVFEKGTSNGTVTSLDGTYSIRTSPDAVLSFSCISYKSVDVSVGGRSVLDITMEEDTEMLNEVLVVGYGTIRKKDLTGAVSAVSSKEFKDSPVSNVGQALQGKVAGLQVIDNGSPGSDVNIKIRGLGSINDCDPLVVIDGVPTDLGLSALNVADIERVDILKDASATAIYGSRGANGVVMVTTKKGVEGKGRLSVTSEVAFQRATNVPELLNAAEYAALNNEMMTASGRNTNPEWADPSSLGEGTDWMAELLQTGIRQKHTVSYSGGSSKSHYYVSGGFLDQKGIVSSVSYRRFNFQANTDAQVLSWLKFSTNITFSADKKKSGDYSISNTMSALPVFSVKDELGEWSGPEGNAQWYGSIRNPIGTTVLNTGSTSGYNILANITGEVSFTPALKFRSTFGYDAKFWFYDSFTPAYDWKPIAVEESSRYESSNKSFTYLWDNYFLYDKTFSQVHHLSAMAGVSAQWNNYDYFNAQKNIFLFDSIHELTNGQKMNSIDGNASDWSLLSFMARVNYSYDDRYLLTATVRRDGSSRFGPKHRWGTFPSASAAWRISREEWFPSINAINDLKLRVGYGVTGSQASVGNYSYLATYKTGVYPLGYDGTEQATLYSSTLSNPSIHWEEVAQTNIGVDVAMFSSRLTLSLDAYWKNTREMLVKASIPITSGFEDTSTTYANAGKVSNRGFEFTAHSVNIQSPVRWETDLSLTYNRNRIVSLNSDVPYYTNQINNSYVTRLAEGYPINTFYGYVTDGIFQTQEEVDAHAYQAGAEPGDIRFKDLNNDGVINDEDRTTLGNPNPSWLYSMNNRISWKGLELSIYLQGVYGNKIYNANNIDNTGMAAALNQTTAVLSRWTGAGTSNSMPRAVYGDPNQNCRVSDRFIEDGSYLRIKNISLSYALPSDLLRKISIESLRIILSCENLATFTKYSGFDPEVALNGIDSSRYPIAKTFSLGLNINF